MNMYLCACCCTCGCIHASGCEGWASVRDRPLVPALDSIQDLSLSLGITG